MAQNFYGSICVTDLLAQVKLGHSATRVGKNEKVYIDISIWINDQKDRFGNDMQILLKSSRANEQSEGKIYIGNCKVGGSTKPEPKATKAASVAAIEKLLK